MRQFSQKTLALAVLTVLLPLSLRAQRTDSLVATYMNESRWFELSDLYAKDSARISPFLEDFSRAMLSHMFNRPRQAIADLRSLLRNHQQDMGFGNIVSMIGMIADDYYKLNRPDSAAATLDAFISQVEGRVDASVWQSLASKRDIMKALAPYLIYQMDGERQFVLPFRNDTSSGTTHLLKIRGAVDGKQASFCFDTGASYNVISSSLADSWGLKPIAGGLAVKGSTRGMGNVVLIRELTLGDMTLRNVPFLILDFKQGNEKAGPLMTDLPIIIGQDLIGRFASYVIDMDRHKITFHTETLNTPSQPTICLPGTLRLRAQKGQRIIDLKLDTGADSTCLATAYYKAFNDEVMREGRWRLAGGAGYGGIRYHSVFNLPKVSLTLGATPVTLKGVNVIAMSDKDNVFEEGYGYLGLDFLNSWSRVEVDQQNMTIRFEPKNNKQ